MTARPKAYSYIRFSTPEQLKGDSQRRQIEKAERYALRNKLELDDQLTFRDSGVSAFQGANEESGRLGDFIKAVEHGDIVPGSVLLVESLDRLSRQKPLQVVALLTRIFDGGVSIVTLNDERSYSHEALNGDPWALMVALLVAIRANEESETKAKRIAASWEAKRRQAPNKPLTAVCPAWLRLSDDRTTFEIISERADVVRRVFRETLEGHGQHGIASRLNQEGVPVFGKGKHWHRSYVSKLLSSEAVVGRFTPHTARRIKGKKVRERTAPIEGYFPAIIEPDVFERVASLSSGRSAARPSQLSNILAGLAVCPSCGSTMTRVNKGSGKKAGKPYLVCTRAKSGAGCKYRQVAQEDVEQAILGNAEQLLITLPSPDAKLQERWEELLGTEDHLKGEIERVSEAIAEAGHSTALLARLRKSEADLVTTESERLRLEDTIAATMTNRVKNTVEELVGICGLDQPGVSAINANLRQLFKSVEVDYRRGELWFEWQHAEEASSIRYAMPEAGVDQSRRAILKR